MHPLTKLYNVLKRFQISFEQKPAEPKVVNSSHPLFFNPFIFLKDKFAQKLKKIIIKNSH